MKNLLHSQKQSGIFLLGGSRIFSALSFAINDFFCHVELLFQNHWVETIFYVQQTLFLCHFRTLEKKTQKSREKKLQIHNYRFGYDELFWVLTNIFYWLGKHSKNMWNKKMKTFSQFFFCAGNKWLFDASTGHDGSSIFVLCKVDLKC